MSKIPFQKFHGFGNDYIVVLNDDLSAVSDISAFTRSICHRTEGAGSDGIAVLEKLDGSDADYSCRIINPDGSEAGFSGNGTRCAVAFLYREGLWDAPKLRLQTKSGVKNYEFLRKDGREFWYLAELGKPIFQTDKIPFVRKADRVDSCQFKGDLLIALEPARRFPYVALNVGNPVCAIFVDEFDPEWRLIGAAVEKHPCFPEKTNVVFVKAVNESNIEIRIWERGAGETSSSGRVRSRPPSLRLIPNARSAR